MIHLQHAPVLGLEFSSCNAEKLYQRTVRPKHQMTLWKFERGARIVSYIPGLGSIAGILYLIGSYRLKNNPALMANRKWHIARSVVECFSCGFLFLIPDLIQTCIWKYQVYQNQTAQSLAVG